MDLAVICESCSAQIWWAKTEKGDLVAVNSTPSPVGDIVHAGRIEASELGAVPVVRTESMAQGGLFGDGQERFTAHACETNGGNR